ncbi:MAG TPA: cupredoxin domain-containing protein [Gemmataceae bacterium]|nr:cupredoxin domain-containing protein [Gemmataceae bacterium]
MRARSAYLVLAVSLVVLGVAPAHGQAQSYGYPGYSPYAYSPYYSPPVYSAPAGQYPRPLGSWYTSPFATSGAYPRPIGSWYTTPLGGSASYPRPIGSWYTTPFPVYNTYTPGYSYSPYSGSYSDSSSPSAPPAAQAEQSATVSISDNAFEPARLTVSVGTTVRWKNGGQHRHTVTSGTAVWDSGKLEPGASYSYTFTKPGTYSYHCALHNGMKGEIVVQ